MTSARLVRLLVVLVLAAGVSAWRSSLFAQVRGDIRQYDPAFDGAAGPPADQGWAEIPAYVSAISGDARLDRDGEVTRDFEQVPLLTGDQLRTTRGRVEVLFTDGSVIALDEYSAVTVDTESTWRLHTGRMKVVSRSAAFAVDAAPIGAARLSGGGDYLITVAVNRRGDPEMELAVARGSAELENALGRTLVRPGTRALTTEAYAPSVPYAFSSPRDEFERWTESLEHDRYGAESVRYLPVELRAYGGDFDRHGYWSRHASYGWVWYPRVAVGWQPFHSGRWTFVVNFGYSWVGSSRWEWPTHHYGRWDRVGSRWCWVPMRPAQPYRVGYAAPRRSVNVSVPYYSRPMNARPMNTRPVNARPDPTPQPRIAVPRSSTPAWDDRPATRDTRPTARETRPTTATRESFPAIRQTRPETREAQPRQARPVMRSTEPMSRTRQAPAPSPVPSDNPRVERPARQSPQPGLRDPSARERQPAARPAPEPPSRPSVGNPAASPRSGSRTPSAGSGLPNPQGGSPGRSGSAVRRGGGRD